MTSKEITQQKMGWPCLGGGHVVTPRLLQSCAHQPTTRLQAGGQAGNLRRLALSMAGGFLGCAAGSRCSLSCRLLLRRKLRSQRCDCLTQLGAVCLQEGREEHLVAGCSRRGRDAKRSASWDPPSSQALLF